MVNQKLKNTQTLAVIDPSQVSAMPCFSEDKREGL